MAGEFTAEFSDGFNNTSGTAGTTYAGTLTSTVVLSCDFASTLGLDLGGSGTLVLLDMLAALSVTASATMSHGVTLGDFWSTSTLGAILFDDLSETLTLADSARASGLWDAVTTSASSVVSSPATLTVSGDIWTPVPVPPSTFS